MEKILPPAEFVTPNFWAVLKEQANKQKKTKIELI